MPLKLLMGNEAIGLGAMRAGVNFVSGYPGTPSTEVLETVAKNNDGSIHVEWSTNEKAALEAAIGASYAGARALVTMKQVGLNVAADPLMTCSYLGVKGGLVLVVADDPGPISSQTEQDTRTFGQFSKVPVLDPSSSQECFEMIADAFEISEKYNTPVILRPTTRVCHACGSVCVSDDAAEDNSKHAPSGFERDTKRWVVFPQTSRIAHGRVEERAEQIAKDFSCSYFPTRIEMGLQNSSSGCNAGISAQDHAETCLQKNSSAHSAGVQENSNAFDANKSYPLGIVTGGISYQYVKEALEQLQLDLPVFKIAIPYPFPEKQAQAFLKCCEKVLVVEELDPYIERELFCVCGKKNITCTIHGKIDGSFQYAGEQSVEAIICVLEKLGFSDKKNAADTTSLAQLKLPPVPQLPQRPPVLCAGCPHRASFYAVKRAMRGKKTVFCGDIGCYTLGNAAPLDMVDTCLCMGADITIAQGIKTIEPDTHVFSFIGDSTFFASGITGVVNAVYNRHDIIICVLDNSTTAMTGQQPNPATGHTMMGVDGSAISIPDTLKALGVNFVETINPLNLEASIDVVKRATQESGVRAIIFKSPCINVDKTRKAPVVVCEDECTRCYACIKQIGCPATTLLDGAVSIDKSLCTGCGLCTQICPTKALRRA